MNLKLIDAAIADYRKKADEGDVARLEFFRALWGALDDCVREAQEGDGAALPAYAAPDAGTVKRAGVEGRPVLGEAPVTVNGGLLSACLARLAAVVVERGAFSEEVADALAQADWDGAVAATDLAVAGSDPSAWLGSFSDALADGGMAADGARLAALFASLALRVQLERPARLVMGARKAAGVVETAGGRPMLCPVCGSAPSMGHVGSHTAAFERGRLLVCAQCGAAWDFERVRCARCGTRNQAHLHFHSVEGDDAHRLETCDECDGYLRVLYSEDALAICSYEVEDVVMARLDALALDPRIAGEGR